MGDSFLTIDAGLLAGRDISLVLGGRALALRGDVHLGEVVAAPAFDCIIRFEASPFMLGESESVVEKFFPCVDGAE